MPHTHASHRPGHMGSCLVTTITTFLMGMGMVHELFRQAELAHAFHLQLSDVMKFFSIQTYGRHITETLDMVRFPWRSGYSKSRSGDVHPTWLGHFGVTSNDGSHFDGSHVDTEAEYSVAMVLKCTNESISGVNTSKAQAPTPSAMPRCTKLASTKYKRQPV